MIFQIYIKSADGNYKVYNSETDKIITVEKLRKDIYMFFYCSEKICTSSFIIIIFYG